MQNQKDCDVGWGAFTVSLFVCGLMYAAVPQSGIVERLCLKLPDVSRVE